MGRKKPDLQRRKPTRAPKRLFIIFCEGRNTEPGYFKALHRYYSGALIDVQTIGGVGVPMTLATQAAARVENIRNPRDSHDAGDQVWAVFDRDDHPQHEEAVMHCENNGVGVGRSNPCFEVWLLLHIEDYHKPDNRDAVQKHLNKCILEYDHKGSKTPNYAPLLNSVEEAEKRAEIQLTNRCKEGKPYGCPSTTVFRLTRAIREASRTST